MLPSRVTWARNAARSPAAVGPVACAPTLADTVVGPITLLHVADSDSVLKPRPMAAMQPGMGRSALVASPCWTKAALLA